MNKFENVDVLASLQQIMQQNTAAFQNDFDIDKKILTRAAKSKNAEDKVYLWFSRPNGTHCLRERDVFLRGTREHNTFRFYHEQTKERVLAYAVVLSGVESGKVKGSIYELDYAAKAELAIQTALRTDNNRLIYEKGSRELSKECRIRRCIFPRSRTDTAFSLLSARTSGAICRCASSVHLSGRSSRRGSQKRPLHPKRQRQRRKIMIWRYEHEQCSVHH